MAAFVNTRFGRHFSFLGSQYLLRPAHHIIQVLLLHAAGAIIWCTQAADKFVDAHRDAFDGVVIGLHIRSVFAGCCYSMASVLLYLQMGKGKNRCVLSGLGRIGRLLGGDFAFVWSL